MPYGYALPPGKRRCLDGGIHEQVVAMDDLGIVGIAQDGGHLMAPQAP